MTHMPRYCHCWDGQARWRVGPDDGFCGLCGRRLASAEPLGLVLAPEAGAPVLGGYLRREPATSAWSGAPLALSGRLTFAVAGPDGTRPRVRWTPQSHPAVTLTGCRQSGRGVLEVGFRIVVPSGTPPGLVGHGLLALDGLGEPIERRVRLYSIDGADGQARLTARPGEPPPGDRLIVYRGAPPLQTFLEYEAGQGVPIRWEGVDCTHPAVQVRLLDPERAGPVSRAEVWWDTTRLAADAPGEKVRFLLRFRELSDYEFVQEVRWRKRWALSARPAALAVLALPAYRARVYPIELTNGDRQPIELRAIETKTPWIQPVRRPGDARLPARIEPGATVRVHLELDARALDRDARGPHAGSVQLRLSGRGTQSYPVRVESVRRLDRIAGPLLIDPGPPRVVVARIGPATGRPEYPRKAGDAGIAPEDLGLRVEDYAGAVAIGRDAETVARRLVLGALERCREWEHWDARQVRVCRQPWFPAALTLDGPDVALEVCDWVALARPARAAGVCVARLDAWETYLVPPDAPPIRLTARAETPGTAVASWLARHTPSARGRPRLDDGPPAAWLRLAAESFLIDYRTSPAHAWERLQHAWRAHVPEARDRTYDRHQADRSFRDRLTDQVGPLLGWVQTASEASGATPAIRLLGGLFGGGHLTGLVHSWEQAFGVTIDARAADWIDRLAQAPAPHHQGERR